MSKWKIAWRLGIFALDEGAGIGAGSAVNTCWRSLPIDWLTALRVRRSVICGPHTGDGPVGHRQTGSPPVLVRVVSFSQFITTTMIPTHTPSKRSNSPPRNGSGVATTAAWNPNSDSEYPTRSRTTTRIHNKCDHPSVASQTTRNKTQEGSLPNSWCGPQSRTTTMYYLDA